MERAHTILSQVPWPSQDYWHIGKKGLYLTENGEVGQETEMTSDVVGGATYYGVLGVSRDASLEDVKAAYRKAVLLLHPDKSHGGSSTLPADKTAFLTLHTAWQVWPLPTKKMIQMVFGATACTQMLQCTVQQAERVASRCPLS